MSSGKDTRDQSPVDTTPVPVAVAADSHGNGPAASGRKSRSGAPPAGRTEFAGNRDTGSALRSVYQHTVDESIPDEMLDLLGKLN